MHRKDWDRTANLPDRHVVKTFIINDYPTTYMDGPSLRDGTVLMKQRSNN